MVHFVFVHIKAVLHYTIQCRILWVILLVFSNELKGQFTTYHENGNGEKVEIPFEYINGFIVVDIIFEKVLPLKFILDTGAENTILLKRTYTDLLKTPCRKRIKLMGSDLSKEVYATICNSTYIQMINLQPVRHNVIVLEEDFLYLEEYTGTKIDGILGVSFFRDMVVKLDYKMKILTLYRPEKFLAKRFKDYQVFDIELHHHKPYLNCITEVNQGAPLQTKLLLDTGAGLSALFHDNTDSLMKLKNFMIKGNLGKGLGGNIEGYMGKIHRLQLGDIHFENMISSFQALNEEVLKEEKVVRNGLLGNMLFERFHVIFDFRNKKLYLKPLKNYNKEFEFDKSGLTVFAYGENLDKFYIKYVIENSPGEIVGLLPGDIILKIGCFSYRWYDLKKVNKILSGKTGKVIKLRIKRGNEILNKEITLKELFENTKT